MHDKLIQRLDPIFRDVFSDPSLKISEATSSKDIEGWDSFTHINLMLEIESAFGVKFTTKELGELSRVGDLVKILKVKTENMA
jgi:acyl carrier protein